MRKIAILTTKSLLRSQMRLAQILYVKEAPQDQVREIMKSSVIIQSEILSRRNKSLDLRGDGDIMKRSSTEIKRFARTDKGFSELSQLKKKNLSALVSKGKVCKDGFFSFSYISYEVQLNPIGWCVRRKESDFIFLRDYLKKKYPQHFVPPLVLTNDKTSESSLRKKEKYFSRFLINVLRNPDLRGSYFLQEFLNTENQEAFERLMEQRK
uniref:PX domain-containing protein n=1 Tax=Euplotes crassus TaxID=5936 RepID=A0A7S3K5Y5_EUPCR|mmetsp:Transcript_11570/g.11515  ORF Transcript_11570/g.11515 Transcript_11570/m.11515 type:complete len:210 (+) Transcript_11570:98-727(+)